jgi:hypothetical protein
LDHPFSGWFKTDQNAGTQLTYHQDASTNNLESQAAETYAKAIKLVYGCAESVPPDMKAAYANLARGTLAR